MKKIIEKYVIDLLEKNNIKNPPVDVEKIAAYLNIKVKRQPYNSKDDLSAMLIRDDNNVIIGVNSSHSEKRQRFSIAHEIGHFLLHEGSKLIVDRQIKYKVNYRDGRSSLGTDIDEIEANRFASSLLIPDLFIIEDLSRYEVHMDDEDNIEKISSELADKYNVSFMSMMLKVSSKLH